MKFNTKYNRYVSEQGNIYRLNKHTKELIECSTVCNNGYLRICVKVNNKFKMVTVHKIIWETFNGEIPDGMEIDHINTVRNDNRLSNLRCVSHKDNVNNINSKKHYSEAKTGNMTSEFGKLFKEMYGIYSKDNIKLYQQEYYYYKKHNKLKGVINGR